MTGGFAPASSGEDPGQFLVTGRQVSFVGKIFSVVSDAVLMPDGHTSQRDWVRHPGAAAVVAVDDEMRAILVRQYRHPVGQFLWELPAGLMDVADERPMAAAARELAEEADLRAAEWRPLIRLFSSPGTSDEEVHVFLARELSDVPEPQRHVRSREEREITVHRVPLVEAVSMVLRGEIPNGTAAASLLAAHLSLT